MNLRLSLRRRKFPRRPVLGFRDVETPERTGLWPSASLFYEDAQNRIRQHPDGWHVHTRDPGHPFVAWELAVRYEAACQEAAFHYTQVCDLPTDDELTQRVAHITALLAEADRLSQLEQSVRPMFPDDTDSIRILSFNPHPQPLEPQESRLLPLATKHLSGINPLLIDALAMRQREHDLHPRIFSLLTRADEQVPGPGIHSAIWVSERHYQYPFDAHYEAVLRPLRYIPAYLTIAHNNPLFVRSSVEMAGAHLEGCIKSAGRAQGIPDRRLHKPLGTLLRGGFAKDLLADTDIADMVTFTQLALNPAKHDFVNDQGRGPVFNYDDAIYAYYLARHFGSTALQASNSLDPLIAAVTDSTRHDRYFWGASLPVRVDTQQ